MSDDLTDILDPAFVDYPGEHVKVGAICVAIIPYIMHRFYTICPLDPDPRSPEHKRYHLMEKKPEELANNDQKKWRLPFKDLNLDNDEDLVIVKVKRRPVVVLSRSISDERKVDPSKIQDSFWCVPSYTLLDDFNHPQAPLHFIEDVFALTYRPFFPLPYELLLHDRMAMLRLDRTQPIQRHHLKPTKRRLSKKWRLYLHEWARFYITGRLGDDDSDKNPNSIASALKAARDALKEELTKKRARDKNNKQ